MKIEFFAEYVLGRMIYYTKVDGKNIDASMSSDKECGEHNFKRIIDRVKNGYPAEDGPILLETVEI